MKTFLIIYFLIGCLFTIWFKVVIDYIGIDRLMEETKTETKLDFNDTTTQILFVFVCVVLWPIFVIGMLTNDGEE